MVHRSLGMTIMTTSRKYLKSYIVISRFSGGGSKMPGVELLVFLILRMWVRSSLQLRTKLKLSTTTFAPSLPTSLTRLLQATWNSESISDAVLDENEVYEALHLIDPSKACGPGEIPGWLLKEGVPWFAELLTMLFSMSLQSGCLPKDWRRGNVTPVFKKGNKHLPSNYRSVGLTSLVVKCLERLIHARITEFLETNAN